MNATLTVTGPSGNIVVPQSYSNGLFTAGSVQRLVLGFDAGTWPTGVYPYTLAVSMTSGGSPVAMSATGKLLIVNRKDSPFGTGWWLAGYERIYPQADSSLVWVGGDGSARLYTKNGTVFRALDIDRPDSITLQGGTYIRYLRGGARVEFTSDGRHSATRDRLGLVTTFLHNAAGQLVNIDAAGFQALRYTFAYRSNTGVLQTVTAPPIGSVTRVVSLTNRTDGRVTQIGDPDNTSVGFDYPNSGGFREGITSRTNRLNVVQSFEYDAAGRLVTARVPLNASETAVTTFCPGESRGFVSTGCSSGPLHPDSAVTVMDGPRTNATDVTTFRLDRFGAPRVIRDAIGNSTQLFRGNRTFPALVTRVVHANGWTNDAFYNATGLITKLVQYAPLGPGRDAVTEYTWDPVWERPTSVTSPEGIVVRSGYDATTGNRIWQESGRPGADTTYFRYYPSGGANADLARAVDAPADAAGFRAVDSLAYDALGNLAELREGHAGAPSTVTRVTRWLNDAVGRPIRVSADINAGGTQQRRDSTGYDVMDRVVHTRASAVGTSPAQEFLQTSQVYDAEGNRRRLDRSASPPASGTPVGTLVSRWGYDRANRVVADTAADGQFERHAYDAAGNDTLVTTRRGHTVRMVYDALNRLQSRTLSAVTYTSKKVGIAGFMPNTVSENKPYPRRPIAPGLTPVGDTVIGSMAESFAYDAMGRLQTANNDDAQVQRTYFSNGQPETETLRIRAYGSSDFTAHTYVTGYENDLDGRRTRVRYPQQVSSGGTPSSTQYLYSPTSGALERVIDQLGDTFTFHTDLRDQLDTLYLPGGITEAFGYDAAGRVLTDRMHSAGGSPLRLTSRTYDARDKSLTSVNTTGALDNHTATYTGLGYLAASAYSDHGVNPFGAGVAYTSTDTMTYDGLGNLFRDTTITTGSTSAGYGRFDGKRDLRYDPVTGRVRAMVSATRQDTVRYDAAGNAEITHYPGTVPSSMDDDRAVYYDALGRVRAVDYRIANGSAALSQMLFTFEEFRYDALGRRVLGRTRRFCHVVQSVDCGNETIRRTIWDGTQELAEIQMPGGDTVSSVTLENDTLPLANRGGVLDENGQYKDVNVFFGRVAYTHGVGIDRPLSVVRFDYADSVFNRPFMRWAPFSLVPHWNLRGEADNGSFADGALAKCMSDGVGQRCVQVRWPFGWTATTQQAYVRDLWHGSLLEDKRDGSGLLFRRSRYMDPATGRFTQEDPIGLAGGLNLYGFAAGDPVNYGDPFGLCPPADQNPYDCPGKMGALVMLGQMAPQVNREVALFLPKQLATAASGLALESAIGKVLGWVTERFAGGAIASGSEDVITLYHQGNLAGGRVSATRSLSTSTSPDLAHYAPDEALQTFKVPRSVFQAWDKAHYVTRAVDTYKGIVTQEIRIEAGASGELNKYLVRP